MGAYRHATIHQLLATQATRQGERPAIGDGEGFEISYRRLLELVNGLMQDMSRAGARPGERISLVMPNGVDMAVALLAVSSFATAVPLNPAYKAAEYRSYFKDLGVKWLILPEDDANPSADVAEEMGIGVLRYDASGSFRISGPGKARAPAKPDEMAAGQEDNCLILLTSGSTGRSKKVPLTHAQVLRSTSDICETLSLTQDDVCLCMWEQFHIGGLVDLLLVPLASGGKVICAGSFSASDLTRLLVPEGVTWFQAVPTTLHELMLHVRTQAVGLNGARLRFIRAVASALSPAMMADVEAMFSVPVIQTFGMTEAGPLITTNRLPPGKRKPGSVGTSCGPEIRIQDLEGRDLPQGERGEIVIRGENVITAYEDAPEANKVSFRDGWFRTGDTGYFDEEGYLYLTGRIKEMINRGGEKITPQEVDDVLQTHGAIAQAASFSVSHPVLGEDVAAAVVLKPGQTLSEADVRRFAAERLASFKVPQRILMLPEMPRDPVGKINRLTLSTLAQNSKPEGLTIVKPAAPQRTAAAPAAASGPLPEIEQRIAAIWARELNLPEVQPDDNFFELGGHSLAGVRVILAIEAEFGRQLPADVWAKVTTVREIAALIARELGMAAPAPAAEAASPQQSGAAHPAQTLPPAYLRTIQLVMSAGQVHTLPNFPTIKAINPDGERPPLFWVFNSPEKEMSGLKPHWDRDQPLFGLFSGSKNLPRSEEVFDMLARHYASAILRLCPRGNFYLGGNCRGAKIAFRILQILNEHKVLPRRVILMEHGTDTVLNYPGDVLFLFGRHSRAKAYQAMNIKDVLAGKFPNVRMRWIDGQHGEFFIPMNVKLLARKLLAFLKGNDRPQEFMEGIKARLTWRAHSTDARFERLVARYKARKKRLEESQAGITKRQVP